MKISSQAANSIIILLGSITILSSCYPTVKKEVYSGAATGALNDARDHDTKSHMIIDETKKQQQANHQDTLDWSDYEGKWKDLNSKNIWVIYPNDSFSLGHNVILYYADYPRAGVVFSIIKPSSLLLKKEMGKANLWKGGKKLSIVPLKSDLHRIDIKYGNGIIRLQKVSGLPKDFRELQEQELDSSAW